jgi:hypothetical protein
VTPANLSPLLNSLPTPLTHFESIDSLDVEYTHISSHLTKTLPHTMDVQGIVRAKPSVLLPAFLAAHFMIWLAAAIEFHLYPVTYVGPPFEPEQIHTYIFDRSLGPGLAIRPHRARAGFGRSGGHDKEVQSLLRHIRGLVKETLHGMHSPHVIANCTLTYRRAFRYMCNCPLAQM